MPRLTCFAWRQAACVLALVLLGHSATWALTSAQTQALSVGETDERIAALQRVMATPDEKITAFLQAMADDAVKLSGTQVLIVRDGKASDPVSGESVALPNNAEDVINNNRMRREIDAALSALQLLSPDAELRLRAAK
ncbi:MAG: urea ABC transporter permease subunit UrtB, partial [Betaproteobacteria bacterium]|nr:urea ABC transporter permease subunit UrtB [Betaproteobacteria bacterium]